MLRALFKFSVLGYNEKCKVMQDALDTTNEITEQVDTSLSPRQVVNGVRARIAQDNRNLHRFLAILQN